MAVYDFSSKEKTDLAYEIDNTFGKKVQQQYPFEKISCNFVQAFMS